MCLKLVKYLDSIERLPINHTIFDHLVKRNWNNVKNKKESLPLGMHPNSFSRSSSEFKGKPTWKTTHKSMTLIRGYPSVFSTLTGFNTSFANPTRYLFTYWDIWMSSLYRNWTFEAGMQSCRFVHSRRPRKVPKLDGEKNIGPRCIRTISTIQKRKNHV